MVRREGKIRDWFSTLSYRKGKPCLTLFIEAEGVRSRDRLEAEILENIASNVELELIMIVSKMGMAEVKIEFIPNGTLDKLKEKRLMSLESGGTTLSQIKIPKLILTDDFVEKQGLL